MPRRRELKGIAYGIAGRFVSRNTDIDGYWAIGVMYKAAIDRGTRQFALNLLTGESTPECKYANRVASQLHQYLLKQMSRMGFEEYQVSNATIDIEFNVAPTTMHLLSRNTWGEPYDCRVTITDDLERKRVCEVFGWCGKHDPSREHRSTRQYA